MQIDEVSLPEVRTPLHRNALGLPWNSYFHSVAHNLGDSDDSHSLQRSLFAKHRSTLRYVDESLEEQYLVYSQRGRTAPRLLLLCIGTVGYVTVVGENPFFYPSYYYVYATLVILGAALSCFWYALRGIRYVDSRRRKNKIPNTTDSLPTLVHCARVSELGCALVLISLSVTATGTAYEKGECNLRIGVALEICHNALLNDALIVLVPLAQLIAPVRHVAFNAINVTGTALWMATYLSVFDFHSVTVLVACLTVTVMIILSLAFQRRQETQARLAFENLWAMQKQREEAAKMREYTLSTVDAIVPQAVTQLMSQGRYSAVAPNTFVCMLRVAGFTRWAVAATPAQIVTFLQLLRTTLDNRTRRVEQLTRLPVLGDEYIVVTGSLGNGTDAETQSALGTWLEDAVREGTRVVKELLLRLHVAIDSGGLTFSVGGASKNLDAAGKSIENCANMLRDISSTMARRHQIVIGSALKQFPVLCASASSTAANNNMAVEHHTVTTEIVVQPPLETSIMSPGQVSLRAHFADISDQLQLKWSWMLSFVFTDPAVETRYCDARASSSSSVGRAWYFGALCVLSALMVVNSGMAGVLKPLYFFASCLPVALAGLLWNCFGSRTSWISPILELPYLVLFMAACLVLPFGNVISNSHVGWSTVLLLVGFWAEATIHPTLIWLLRQLPIFVTFAVYDSWVAGRTLVDVWFYYIYIVLSVLLDHLQELNRREAFVVSEETECLRNEMVHDISVLKLLLEQVAPEDKGVKLVRSAEAVAKDPVLPTQRLCIPHTTDTHCTTKALELIVALIKLDDAVCDANEQAVLFSNMKACIQPCSITTAVRGLLIIESTGDLPQSGQAAAIVQATKDLLRFLREDYPHVRVKGLLLNGVCIGGVLGYASLNFCYFGPGVAAALEVVDGMCWGTVVATPRFVFCLWCHLLMYERSLLGPEPAEGRPFDAEQDCVDRVLERSAVKCLGVVVHPALPWYLCHVGKMWLHAVVNEL